MKSLLAVLAVIFLGWPALIVGYAAGAIKSGFLIGVFLYDKHEEEAIDKFYAGRKE